MLHIYSCVAHGLTDTPYGKHAPIAAQRADFIAVQAAQYNDLMETRRREDAAWNEAAERAEVRS